MVKRNMTNLRMQEKLEAGEAFDVSDCARTDDGDYILEMNGDDNFDVDFCDAVREAWIWSIGRLLKPRMVKVEGKETVLPRGTYLASTDSHHYTMGQSTEVECVWLR